MSEHHEHEQGGRPAAPLDEKAWERLRVRATELANARASAVAAAILMQVGNIPGTGREPLIEYDDLEGDEL